MVDGQGFGFGCDALVEDAQNVLKVEVGLHNHDAGKELEHGHC